MQRIQNDVPGGSDNCITRSVVITEGGETVLVSTIDLMGIDHGWNGKSLFYETMVFTMNPEGTEVVDWCERDSMRYETRKEAMEGHADMVTSWFHHVPERLALPAPTE